MALANVSARMPAPELLEMSCRVCGRRDVESVLDLGSQPHCNALLTPEQLDKAEPVYPLRFGFCRTCTTSQIDFTVPKESMFSDYLYVSGTTNSLREHFRRTSEKLVERLELKPGDLVVDIGSNDGTWLKQFQSLGLHVLGVEPAHNLAEQAEADGVPTMEAFFNAAVADEVLARGEAPKLVTAAGVFFHLEELHSATEGLAALCRDGGRCCIQAIYLGDMVAHNAFDQIYHEHLTYWTVTSFEHLLHQYGLEIQSVDVVPIHGGSLEMLIGPAGSADVDPSVDAFREREADQGLTRVEAYHEFAQRVWQIRDGLLEILEAYAAEGRTVHAFGAPAKGATLLNSFGISNRLVQTAVERNPLKVGRTIPGCRIPIVEEGSVPEPDVYLMLPWNFLDEFVVRRADYLAGGGAFLVPIPEPHVVDAAAIRA